MFRYLFRKQNRDQDLVATVTRKMNDAITAMGGSWELPLVPGARNDPDNSPLTKTFVSALHDPTILVRDDNVLVSTPEYMHALVDAWGVRPGEQAIEGVYMVELPQELRDFLDQFNAGLLRWLIDEPTKEAHVVVRPPVYDHEQDQDS